MVNNLHSSSRCRGRRPEKVITYSSSCGPRGEVKALECMLRSISLNGEPAGKDFRIPRPGDYEGVQRSDWHRYCAKLSDTHIKTTSFQLCFRQRPSTDLWGRRAHQFSVDWRRKGHCWAAASGLLCFPKKIWLHASCSVTMWRALSPVCT